MRSTQWITEINRVLLPILGIASFCVVGLVFFMSENRYITTLINLCIPLFGLVGLFLSKKYGKPYIYSVFILNSILIFLLILFGGPNCPGWMMYFTLITMSFLFLPSKFYKWGLLALIVVLNTVGLWLIGSPIYEILSISISLLIVGTLLERSFEFLFLQQTKIEKQKKFIEEKQQETEDSIRYAKRLQMALLPSDEKMRHYLLNSFILYKPKHIVGGDFYWLESLSSKEERTSAGNSKISNLEEVNKNNSSIIFAAADCTGHGVPGAMVSVICNNCLNRAVREFDLTRPSDILNKTRELIIQEFQANNNSNVTLDTESFAKVKDGMDIALCKINGYELSFSGANNPIWIVRNEELIEIKGNKQPVAHFDYCTPFTNHTFDLLPQDMIYVFSDGYADQFGGEHGKKFQKGKFKRLLVSLAKKPLFEQYELLLKEFNDWKGSTEQTDDVCLIGLRIQ